MWGVAITLVLTAACGSGGGGGGGGGKGGGSGGGGSGGSDAGTTTPMDASTTPPDARGMDTASARDTFAMDATAATDTATDTTTTGGPLRAVKLSSGNAVVCAVMSNGTVRCNARREGDWQELPGVANAVDVAVGGGSIRCIAFADGTVRCWGSDDHGQLGQGTSGQGEAILPRPVPGITDAKAVAAGQSFACALLRDGTVKCWGDNGWYELAQGSIQPAIGGGSGELPNGPELCGGNKACSTRALTVPGVANATQISAAYASVCAVIGDGSIKCWGFRAVGVLGDGIETEAGRCNNIGCFPRAPVTVSGIGNAVKVAMYAYHACAVLADGGLKCWGTNATGNLGIGNTTGPESCTSAAGTFLGNACSKSPVVVPGLTNVKDVDVGAHSTCAVLGDGTARCWGQNRGGQLGNGTIDDAASPVVVTGLSGATAIHLTSDSAMAVMGDGTLRSWGNSVNGQLGLGKAYQTYDTCWLGGWCRRTATPVAASLLGKEASCAQDPPQASCSYAARQSCLDYVNFPPATLPYLQPSCTQQSGTWSTSGCTSTGRLGACQTVSGSASAPQCNTYSEYGGDVEKHYSSCMSMGGRWIAPG